MQHLMTRAGDADLDRPFDVRARPNAFRRRHRRSGRPSEPLAAAVALATMLTSLPAVADAPASYPAASKLTGREIISPVRQNGRDVSVSVGQLIQQGVRGLALQPGVLSTFPSTTIDPNKNGEPALPTASLGCHQVGQVYVASQVCLGMNAATAAETYMVSINLADTDNGAAPGSGAPGSAGTDKVGLYIGVDGRSSHSDVWGQNTTLTVRNGAMGGIAYEFDVGTYNAKSTPYGLFAVGDKGVPVGILMTGIPDLGGNPSAVNGPAYLCASAGAGAMWTDCIASGGGIRDNFLEDDSSANVSLHVEGTHAEAIDIQGTDRGAAIDMSGATLAAGIKLRSGNSAVAGAGQNITWTPHAGGTLTGGADTISDRGSGLYIGSSVGLTLTSGSGGIVLLNPVQLRGSMTATGALAAQSVYSSGVVRTAVFSVAALPTCNSGADGDRAQVSDATTRLTGANIGTTVAGGGPNNVPVDCDGTHWVIE